MWKILLVDDSKTINKIISSTLTEAGHEVISCFDVDSAISQLKQNSATIRLVITDLIMPDKDGIELIDYIHQNSLAGVRPRIIAISGGSSGTVTAETAVMAVESRVEQVLKKPFSPQCLISVVKYHLEH